MEFTSQDLFENMPTEIVGLITSNLKFTDSNNLLSTNKRLKKILERNGSDNFFASKTFGALSWSRISTPLRTSHIRTVAKSFKRSTLTVAILTLIPAAFGELSSSEFSAAYAPLSVVSTDGGEYSMGYPVTNLLKDTSGYVYCTNGNLKTTNINVVFESTGDKPIFIRGIKIQGPTWGFTAPITTGAVFLFDTKPDVASLDEFNDYTMEQWEALTSVIHGVDALKQAKCPVLFSDTLDKKDSLSSRVSYFNFEFPYPTAKYIVFKMISSGGDRVNIDCASFIVYGGTVDDTEGTLTVHNRPEANDSYTDSDASDYDD